MRMVRNENATFPHQSYSFQTVTQVIISFFQKFLNYVLKVTMFQMLTYILKNIKQETGVQSFLFKSKST